MLFGFHEYRKSVAERFSGKNRIYLLLLILFGFLSALIFFLSRTNTIRHIIPSSAKEKDNSPIAENFSAPYSQAQPKTPTKKQVIGFLPSWSIAQDAKVYPEYLDQIIYFGIGIDEKGNLMKYDEKSQPLVEWSYLNSEYFKKLQSDSKKTSTKILVAIKNFDNAKIDTLISSPGYSANAISQLKKLVEEYKLDGVNIDFEYFSDTNFPTLQHYNRFLTDLTSEIRLVKPDAIVSVDVNATVVYNDNAYDMVKIGEVVDQVIIMGYDFHQAQSLYSGPVAPINSETDKPSISKTIKSLEGRVDKKKLILGVPLYGYEWQTYTSGQFSKTYDETGAIATYKRVRELITGRTDVSLHFDETSLSPWLTYNQNGLIKQIYYEDERSLLEKMKFMESSGLAGIAFWALGYEGEFTEPWTLLKDHEYTQR